MSSVDKEFADNIVKHGGWYNGDSDNSLGDNPRVIRIWAYENVFNSISYKLIFDKNDLYYDGSELTRAKLYADMSGPPDGQ